jgi:hypothetical protein
MFRVIEPVEISFAIAARLADVWKKIIQTIITKGGRIKVDDQSTILAGFGSSWKVRLLGAMILGAKSMPRDVLVQMKDTSGQIQISIVVRDTFGFGSRAGFSDKLQKLVYEDAFSIKKLFSNPSSEAGATLPQSN